MIIQTEVRRGEADQVRVQTVKEGDQPRDGDQPKQELSQLLLFDNLRDIDDAGRSHRYTISNTPHIRRPPLYTLIVKKPLLYSMLTLGIGIGLMLHTG